MRTIPVVAAILITVTACATAAPATTRPAHTLTDEQRGLAVTAAHHEAERLAIRGGEGGWPEHIDSVTGAVGSGGVTDSNTGQVCDSGTILRVDLTGDFATGAGGYPGITDTTVNEVDLKVDGESGDVCLIGVRTSVAPRDPDADVLFQR